MTETHIRPVALLASSGNGLRRRAGGTEGGKKAQPLDVFIFPQLAVLGQMFDRPLLRACRQSGRTGIRQSRGAWRTTSGVQRARHGHSRTHGESNSGLSRRPETVPA